MEANMLPRPAVTAQLGNFIAVELFTASGPYHERNQQLEEKLYQTVALPIYAVLTPDGQRSLVPPQQGMERDEAKFVAFLEQGRAAARAAGATGQLAEGR